MFLFFFNRRVKRDFFYIAFLDFLVARCSNVVNVDFFELILCLFCINPNV